jgi:hypothetical protein
MEIIKGNRRTRKKHAPLQFFHHKSHITWPGMEPGPQNWLNLCHGRKSFRKLTVLFVTRARIENKFSFWFPALRIFSTVILKTLSLLFCWLDSCHLGSKTPRSRGRSQHAEFMHRVRLGWNPPSCHRNICLDMANLLPVVFLACLGFPSFV